MAKRKTATVRTPPRKPPQSVTPKRTPQLWDYVTREGTDGIYQITKISSDGVTCTLTLLKAGRHTNLEHPRIAITTLKCVEGPKG